VSTVSLVDIGVTGNPPAGPDRRVIQQWNVAAPDFVLGGAGTVAFGEDGRLYIGDSWSSPSPAVSATVYELNGTTLAVGDIAPVVVVDEAGTMEEPLTLLSPRRRVSSMCLSRPLWRRPSVRLTLPRSAGTILVGETRLQVLPRPRCVV
ncbi:MAG: hypothetical protein AAFU77_18045, partial [Myxococcota bacterium]